MIGIIIKKEGILILGIFIYLLILIVRLLIDRSKINKKFLKSELVKLILVVYVLLLIGVTLFPMRISKELIPISPILNLNPFSILEYRINYYSFINLLGNFILLMPLPILLLKCGKEQFNNIKYTTNILLLISIGIEAIQFIQAIVGLVYVARATDILDVIFNVIGGICSVIIYKKIINNNSKINGIEKCSS